MVDALRWKYHMRHPPEDKFHKWFTNYKSLNGHILTMISLTLVHSQLFIRPSASEALATRPWKISVNRESYEYIQDLYYTYNEAHRHFDQCYSPGKMIFIDQYCLTHWGRVTHICVGNLTIIGSDNGLSAPSHYLNQCWNIVNWTLRNKFQWNCNRNSNIFIQENAFENIVCEMASICLGLNVLIRINTFSGKRQKWNGLFNDWMKESCCNEG